MKTTKLLGGAMTALLMTTAFAVAGPEVVSGPGVEPQCFAPWSGETKFLQWPAKEGPYRIAVVNGFVGNTWRIQMIKTAKAFAEDPAIAARSKSSRWCPPAPMRRPSSAPSRTSSTRGSTPSSPSRCRRTASTGDPPRRPRERGHRAVRQRARHRRGDAGQRRPARHGPDVGRVRAQGTQGQGRDQRQGSRSARPAGNSVDRDRSAAINEVFDADDGDWELIQWWATGTMAPPRRW